MRCERWSSTSVIHVSVHFFREASCPPTHVSCCDIQLSARSAQSASSGTFKAPSNGVILLEVELRTRGTADIQASLAKQSNSLLEGVPCSSQIMNSPIIDNTSSWNCWWSCISVLVLALSLSVWFVSFSFSSGMAHEGLSGNTTNS